MARYEILTEMSHFEVTTRPGMPGLGARVAPADGWFFATCDENGWIDLSAPVTGEFSVVVLELRTGDQLLAAAAQRWLDGSEAVSVRGVITELRPIGIDRFDVLMTVAMPHHTVPLRGTGRVTADGEGGLEVTGTTMCDPRAFGLSLPPLVNLMVHVRWRIALKASGD